MILDLVKLFALPLLLIVAAVSDLMTMTIPNRIALIAAAAFFAVAAASGMSLELLGLHVGAGLLVLVIAFACFAFGWIGGGDAKLAAVIALWFGFADLMNFLLYAALFGGLLTLALMAFRKLPILYALYLPSWALRLYDSKNGIPYGVALAAAAILLYPETPWMETVDLSRFIIG